MHLRSKLHWYHKTIHNLTFTRYYLDQDIFKACGVSDIVADHDQMGFLVGQRSQAIIVILSLKNANKASFKCVLKGRGEKHMIFMIQLVIRRLVAICS